MPSNKLSASFFCILICLSSVLFSQSDSLKQNEKDSISYLKNYTTTYHPRIQTLRAKAQNSEHSEPIISIYPGSKLEVSFDDLSDDYIDYHYDLVYCDRYWNPLSLSQREYYDSQSSNTLNDYEFSSATKVDYTHYKLVLPKDGDRFLKSGNYLLHIVETESDSAVITCRFMVVDPKVSINAEVDRPDDVRYRDYRQQVRFTVKDPNSVMEDIGRIYVRINKNASWDIYCDEIKPSFVNNDIITFNRLDACTFDAGNEYRFFNMIEFRNISNNIIKVNIANSGLHSMWLDVDKPRSYLQYSSLDDWNGKAIYTSELKTFNDNELDYALIHFTFKPDENLFGQEIFLYGELSQFRLSEDYKLEYNADRERYEISKLLKQGLYNYEYVVKSVYSEGPDEGILEGSHYETENEYTVYIYYSNAFEGIDELLGIERINSRVKLDE